LIKLKKDRKEALFIVSLLVAINKPVVYEVAATVRKAGFYRRPPFPIFKT